MLAPKVEQHALLDSDKEDVAAHGGRGTGSGGRQHAHAHVKRYAEEDGRTGAAGEHGMKSKEQEARTKRG